MPVQLSASASIMVPASLFPSIPEAFPEHPALLAIIAEINADVAIMRQRVEQAEKPAAIGTNASRLASGISRP